MESTFFLIAASVAIPFLLLMLFLALFEPGLPYTFAQRPSERLDSRDERTSLEPQTGPADDLPRGVRHEEAHELRPCATRHRVAVARDHLLDGVAVLDAGHGDSPQADSRCPDYSIGGGTICMKRFV